ncbi:hypothetical protein [Klenkia sp. PcliD-1-E]|uniref:hypothetical protein n=1 Tax=Klenkia sp. PcliD-1-E TaxID=2954492 RepID=UPI002096B467|nr:hypothetical protein [Klenkia sp. PcliD-1-E]MCO7218755.1 hypothetical protein [Klenkia sp. PcliD-1-E]
MSVLRRPRRLDAVVAAASATLLALLGIGGGLYRLQVPLDDGDMLPAYAATRLWSTGAPFGDASLGAPFGIEQRYYPTADVVQNAVAGLLAWVAGNPFLGLNLAFVLSFPATALAGIWVLGIAGLRGPWAVVLTLALTFVPFHWYRTDHVYLATSYSAVVGVGLALLVGSGQLEQRLRGPARRRAWLVVVGAGLLVAASGIYYACFTVLLVAAAAAWRWVRGARVRDAALAAVPAVAVVVGTVVLLAPSILYVRSHPPLAPLAARETLESVLYAGSLVLALIPAPVPSVLGRFYPGELSAGLLSDVGDLDLAEGQRLSNFGSVATVLACVVVLVGVVRSSRRSARAVTVEDGGRVGRGAEDGDDGEDREDGEDALAAGAVTLPLVGFLALVCLLFFVPWGLNLLFAYLVMPEIRAWNRLLPEMYTLLFVAAAVVGLRWRPRVRPRAGRVLVGLGLVVVVVDSVLPARAHFADAEVSGSRMSGAGYQYAAALNAAVPGRCAVLELPYVRYPETPPKQALENYEPLWPALTNPGKTWSAAAMKDTAASAWQARLGDSLTAEDLEPLAAGGFCAVHVDRRGYTPADADAVTAQLTDLLGAPVATGLDGDWSAYRLPTDGVTVLPPAELVQAPGELGTFWAPPQLRPVSGAPEGPVTSTFHQDWVLSPDALLDVDALDGGAPFRTVRGEVAAGGCTGEVTVALRDPDSGEVTTSTTVPAGVSEAAPFRLYLPGPVRRAELSVSAPGCPTTADPPATVLLRDPEAVG